MSGLDDRRGVLATFHREPPVVDVREQFPLDKDMVRELRDQLRL
jgi:hypothetical protein